jgi:hypothetical protein
VINVTIEENGQKDPVVDTCLHPYWPSNQLGCTVSPLYSTCIKAAIYQTINQCCRTSCLACFHTVINFQTIDQTLLKTQFTVAAGRGHFRPKERPPFGKISDDSRFNLEAKTDAMILKTPGTFLWFR